VELVARGLDYYWWYLAVHSFILIHSINEVWYEREYTISWQMGNKWKMKWEFNYSRDKVIIDDIYKPAIYKESLLIDASNWISSQTFVQNIYNEYIEYNENQKKYYLQWAWNENSKGWNCNNFATTVLYYASWEDTDILKQISDFDPVWINNWIWTYFKK
jgi:hypothetical protein